MVPRQIEPIEVEPLMVRNMANRSPRALQGLLHKSLDTFRNLIPALPAEFNSELPDNSSWNDPEVEKMVRGIYLRKMVLEGSDEQVLFASGEPIAFHGVDFPQMTGRKKSL